MLNKSISPLSYDPADLSTSKAIISTLCAAICFYLFYCKYLHALSKYPGPFLAAFGPAWATYVAIKGDWVPRMTALHAEYGNIVRIGRNEVDIDDVDAIDAIYGLAKGFTKTEFYSAFGDPRRRANIFSTRDDAYHAQIKRFMSSAFTMKALQAMDVQLNDCISSLLRKLDVEMAKNKVVDLGYLLKCTAFDVSSYISNGDNIGAVDGKDEHKIMDAMTAAQNAGGITGRIWNIRKVLACLQPPEEILDAFIYLEKFMRERIAFHKAHESHEMHSDNNNNMMGMIMNAHTGKSRDAYPLLDSDDYLYGEVSQTVIAAGADTTGTTLIALLYYLIRCPSAYLKLQEEVDAVTSYLSEDGTFSASIANDMPYLNVVIKEALRIHPAVGFPLPRYVPKSGLLLNGNYFAPGTIVGVNAVHIHQHEEIFGKDCQQFRPERWLEADKAQLTKMDKYLFSFGYGSRTCLGKNISLVEMRLLVPALMARFDIKAVDVNSPLEYKTRWFSMLEHLDVELSRRADVA